MISDYFKRIENYLGNLTKDQKELLIKAKEQLSNGYQQESYMYDSLIKKQAYAIFYGPIYALQSTVILCNENSLAFFIRQPDKIFVHGCAHFPESYGLNKLFSLKKWNLGESKINLLEREADWELLIRKISMIPRQHFFKIDFIKDKSKASEIYTDSKTPLYVFQNCLNEGQNNEIVKTIIHCYKKAPKGAIFAISSIIYADPKTKKTKQTFNAFDSTFEGLQSQIEGIGYSKIKKYNDELSYYPKFTSDDFKDLTLEQKWDKHGVHGIYPSVLQPISGKYQDKYMAIKVKMSFKYILVRK
jgi:hypothetical protein